VIERYSVDDHAEQGTQLDPALPHGAAARMALSGGSTFSNHLKDLKF
jgi:hypothetical protein